MTNATLSAAEWRNQIVTYGYVIVPDVVPKSDLDETVADIWKHIAGDPRQPETWYRPNVVRPIGMLDMYHYQSLWNNRQNQHVYEVFREIHQTDSLWVSIDRVGFKPPVNERHPEYDHQGMIHWDADMTRYPNIPFYTQGVLALTDTEPDMGGFQCVPESYHHLDEYLRTQTTEQIASRMPDISQYPIERPRLRAGDLLIWTSLLLHGNGHNVSGKPRLCQYLSMNPARDDSAQLRGLRIESWRSNTPPPGESFYGDSRRIEETQNPRSKLSPLGRKLLGIDPWE